MASDREVEVSVNAEGVDEAAGEMGGEEAAGVGGPGGGGGGGKVSGKLLTRLLGVIAFLGPILDVLGIVSDILEAFLAPVAVLLLRLLQPALMLLIRVLPVWFEIMSVINDAAEIWAGIRSDMFNFLLNLPGMLATAVKNELPEFPSLDGDGFVQRGVDFVTGDDGGGGDGRDGPLVAIGGGLLPFVDRLTQDGSVDFP